MKNFNDLISENFEKLNDSDLKIYNYIANNKNKISTMEIKDLAQKLKVSSSYISEFSKKIGLDGFMELKYLLKWEKLDIEKFDHKELEYTFNDIISTMLMIRSRNLDDFFEKFDKANNIYACFSGLSQKHASEELQRALLNISKDLYIIEDYEMAYKLAKDFNSKDILFVFSFGGENQRLIEYIKEVKQKVTIISITRLSNNTISILSDYNIPFLTHSVYTYNNYLKVNPTAQFFVLIDFLVLKYLEYKS
ncbi:MAG: MurR/RpiR family transcriptional regulator [Tissierellia bacterium]|nr:MurR/RpiR family transcriptional regulator [Tissierellia bacterium]